MSLVVGCVNGSAVCNQFAGDHVLAVQTRDVQARVAVAANGIDLNAVVQQQPHDVDLTARRRRMQRREHLNT